MYLDAGERKHELHLLPTTVKEIRFSGIAKYQPLIRTNFNSIIYLILKAMDVQFRLSP